MTLGDRIRKRRLELKLTQYELAKRLGYTSRAAVCALEKDKDDITINRLFKIAEALETSPEYLLGLNSKSVSTERNLINLLNDRPELAKLLKVAKDASAEEISLVISMLKHMV